MIPIFLSADNNYAPYLPVVIKSVCENTDSILNFYILDGGINETSKNNIISTVSKYKNSVIEFINPEPQNIFSKCYTSLYISETAYYRLLIPNLKPDIDRAIYLDTDLIVNMDISELFNQDIGDNIIGARYEECNEKYHSVVTKKKLGINIEHKYFNSGVLLIDCKKWRENNITQLLKEIYDKNEDRIIFHDQDLLNILFSTNKYFSLDKKFNYLLQAQYEENQRVIYHYFGSIKPWQFLPELNTDIVNYKDIWWEYAKKTIGFEAIKEICIYKNEDSLRKARATKIHQMLNRHKIEQAYEEIMVQVK